MTTNSGVSSGISNCILCVVERNPLLGFECETPQEGQLQIELLSSEAQKYERIIDTTNIALRKLRDRVSEIEKKYSIDQLRLIRNQVDHQYRHYTKLLSAFADPTLPWPPTMGRILKKQMCMDLDVAMTINDAADRAEVDLIERLSKRARRSKSEGYVITPEEVTSGAWLPMPLGRDNNIAAFVEAKCKGKIASAHEGESVRGVVSSNLKLVVWGKQAKSEIEKQFLDSIRTSLEEWSGITDWTIYESWETFIDNNLPWFMPRYAQPYDVPQESLPPELLESINSFEESYQTVETVILKAAQILK